MVTIPFPADRAIFVFFGADSSGQVHCFDCSLVSAVYQWIHVSSVMKRYRNSFAFRLNSVKPWCEVVSRLRLSKVSERANITLPLSFVHNFIPDITYAVFWDTYCLIYLAHLQFVVCGYEIMDFRHPFVRLSLSFVAAVFGTLGSGPWNSVNQYLSVAIEGEEIAALTGGAARSLLNRPCTICIYMSVRLLLFILFYFFLFFFSVRCIENSKYL